MKKIIVILITTFFFLSMIFLAAFAKKIKENTLPKVEIQRVSMEKFPVTTDLEEGNVPVNFEKAIGLDISILEQGVFIVYEQEKNGTNRFFLKEVIVSTGRTYDDFVEITTGLTTFDSVVISSNKQLVDGGEVVVLSY